MDGREVFFDAQLYTGWDRLLALLPVAWQAERIARRLPGPPECVMIGLPSGSCWLVVKGKAQKPVSRPRS